MKVCPYCAHSNREGLLFCEDCGQSLSSGSPPTLPTRQLDQSASNIAAKATWGTARFGQDASIIIHVRDAPEPIVLQPAKQMTLGRADATSTQKPDLDLTPYGALEKGVSRMHAAIHRSDDTLTLVDMGSINGTHLNGQRLIPDQPRVLRDGDEIRLGKLVAHIYFK
jgi:pSer/pThr/pTyr-binding forkhead associated (FHA) protein